MDGHNISLRQQLIFGHKTCSAGLFNLWSSSSDIVIDYFHLKTDSAPRHHLTNTTQTEDAQRCMMNIHAQKLL